MKRIAMRTNCALALALAGVLAAAPTLAEKPSGAGKGAKHEQGEKSGHQSEKSGHQSEKSGHQGEKSGHDKSGRHNGDEQSSRNRAGPAVGATEHFGDRHRSVTHQYYDDQFRSGRCPPGLAKKHNGCMPPGQAKKWRMGQPLARDVVIYDVPPALVVRIGAPPPGYKYVRVASDILLIAVGTRMVADAITDLGRR
jgi:hypothetical protein